MTESPTRNAGDEGIDANRYGSPAVIPRGGGAAVSGHQGVSLTKPRVVSRACDACRRMKVKCENPENPPCIRCRKSGRDCCQSEPDGRTIKRPRLSAPRNLEQRLPDRQHSIIEIAPNSTAPGNTLSVNEYEQDADGANRQVIGGYKTNLSRVHPSGNDILAIYSTSPLDAVREPLNRSHPPTPDKSSEARRRGQEVLWGITDHVNTQAPDDGIEIPRRDLRGIIKIFCEKLLTLIPALPRQDFRDADMLIDTDLSLVYCICYVTARVLPEGKKLREMLVPKVSQILKGKFTSGRNQANDMSTLRSLLILYSYANVSNPTPHESETSRPEELLHWPLKSLVEAYALRMSLHRSVYELQALLRSPTGGPITETVAYQKYTVWLQLFTMARYASVMSGTPPTIPIDPTIRAAPGIMKQIGKCDQAGLFAQVELLIAWEKVGQGKLGEWWCQRDPTEVIDEQETESMLHEATRLIDLWYGKWLPYMMEDDERAGILDYYGKCARFWLHSYATKNLQRIPATLPPIQKEQIRRCIKYASDVLDWPVLLTPFQKDSLRYFPEHSCVMVSFCSLFILASCQAFGADIPEVYAMLDKVTAAAQLMLDTASDPEHTGHIQGLLILKRVAALKKPSASVPGSPRPVSRATLPPGPNNDDLINDLNFDFTFPDDGMLGMDMIWDFSAPLPGVW